VYIWYLDAASIWMNLNRYSSDPRDPSVDSYNCSKIKATQHDVSRYRLACYQWTSVSFVSRYRPNVSSNASMLANVGSAGVQDKDTVRFEAEASASWWR
jgi:hypothetical protein